MLDSLDYTTLLRLVLWSIFFFGIAWALVRIINGIKDAQYRRTLVSPDKDGRYPLIVFKTKKGVVAFDREKGWGLMVVENAGKVSVIESPETVLSHYKDIEIARAQSMQPAPMHYSPTNNPSYTYAPSNTKDATVIDNAGDGESATDTLSKLMRDDPMEHSENITQELELVELFDVLEERQARHVILGKQEDGSLLQVDIMSMFHHLVGGMSGFGKSVYLRSLVYQFLEESSSTPLELCLADIENNTFPEFRYCKGVRNYASNYLEIEHMTTRMLEEIEHRKELYETLRGGSPKDIERYNVLARREGREELPIIIVMYDEFTALMHKLQAQQKRIFADVYQLALRARKYGVFLIVAGHSFKADLIDSTVTGQFGFNICFKVKSPQQSIMVIGQTGAEHINQPGAAFVKNKAGTVSRIQALYVDDDQLLDALEQFKDSKTMALVPEIVREIVEFAASTDGDKVLFKGVVERFKEHELSRADIMRALTWMDDHNFVTRNDKNGRVLNREVVKDFGLLNDMEDEDADV